MSKPATAKGPRLTGMGARVVRPEAHDERPDGRKPRRPGAFVFFRGRPEPGAKKDGGRPKGAQNSNLCKEERKAKGYTSAYPGTP